MILLVNYCPLIHSGFKCLLGQEARSAVKTFAIIGDYLAGRF